MIILFAAIAVSCENKEKDARAFEKILENSSGQDHSLAKFSTEQKGFMVFKNEVTGEYTAYNLSHFDRKDVTSYDAYLASAASTDVVGNLSVNQEWVVSGHWYEESTTNTYCDQDNYCWSETTYYTTDVWVDTSHWYTFYTGGGLRFDNTNPQSKDLETLAALEEDLALKIISYQLGSEYSLSSHRADQMARLALRYQRLENKRELTESEKGIFAMEALGVSLTQVENSLRARAQGHEAQFEDLLETAARVNQTTPEQIGRFFEDYIK